MVRPTPLVFALLLVVIASSPALRAQSAGASSSPARALTAPVTATFVGFQDSVLRAAELMPEADFEFRPTPDLRPFGRIIAHVADAHLAFCTALAGEREPVDFRVERTVTGKAAVIAELKAAGELCSSALARLDDAAMARPVAFGGGRLIDGTEIRLREAPAGLLATLLTAHTRGEYGKLTVYLRLKGLTPPTSAPRSDR